MVDFSSINNTPGLAKAPPAYPGSLLNAKSNAMNVDLNPDEMSQLLPTVLKQTANDPGVAFPSVTMKEQQGNDLILHKYPNLGGARIENMGRNPAVFMVRAIFTNNIYPGFQETWKPGLLFPNAFVALVNLLYDTGTKLFQHPIYGNITVQVHTWDYELKAKGPRDGAFVNIVLVETISDDTPLNNTIGVDPSIAVARTAAALDTAIAGADSFSLPNISLSQFFAQVSAAIKQVVSYPQNLVNGVNETLGQVSAGLGQVGGALITFPGNLTNSLLQFTNSAKFTPFTAIIQNSINYDATAFNAFQSLYHLNGTVSSSASQYLNKVLRCLIDLEAYYIALDTWEVSQVIDAIRSFKAAVIAQLSSLSQNSKTQNVKVATYKVQNPITFSALAGVLHNNIDDIISLNPALASQLFVPANTSVSYYQAL